MDATNVKTGYQGRSVEWSLCTGGVTLGNHVGLVNGFEVAPGPANHRRQLSTVYRNWPVYYAPVTLLYYGSMLWDRKGPDLHMKHYALV